jgi:hypothetical protein
VEVLGAALAVWVLVQVWAIPVAWLFHVWTEYWHQCLNLAVVFLKKKE